MEGNIYQVFSSWESNNKKKDTWDTNNKKEDTAI